MIEHSRRLIERANQLKRQDEMRIIIENIQACKVLFINLYELFAKTIVKFDDILMQTNVLQEYKDKRDALLQRYEKIMNLINSKSISVTETELFQKLCTDIRQEQNNLNDHIQTAIEAIKEASESTVEQLNNVPANENATLNAVNASEVSVTDGNTNNLIVGSVSNVGSEDRIKYYYELMQYLEAYETQIRPILADPNAKKFRFNCQKAISTPVNTIAATNPDHLQVCFENYYADKDYIHK